MAEKYKDQGLEVVAVSVQETTPDDVRDYRDRYDLDFTVGFDGSGHVFHQYRVYALPTQFFVDPDGAIRYVAQGPLSLAARPSGSRRSCRTRPPRRRRPEGAQRRANARFVTVASIN